MYTYHLYIENTRITYIYTILSNLCEIYIILLHLLIFSYLRFANAELKPRYNLRTENEYGFYEDVVCYDGHHVVNKMNLST